MQYITASIMWQLKGARDLEAQLSETFYTKLKLKYVWLFLNPLNCLVQWAPTFF